MSRPADRAMSDLTALPEIGPVVAGQLIAVGIENAGQLRACGAADAFMRIRTELDPGACIHLLLALEAAIQGVRTTALDPAVRQDLRDWFRSLEPVSDGG